MGDYYCGLGQEEWWGKGLSPPSNGRKTECPLSLPKTDSSTITHHLEYNYDRRSQLIYAKITNVGSPTRLYSTLSVCLTAPGRVPHRVHISYVPDFTGPLGDLAAVRLPYVLHFQSAKRLDHR